MRLTNKEFVPALIFLCLVALLPFWRLVTGPGMVITNDYAVSDIANLQYPLRHAVGQALRQGDLPLWTPGVYMGFPLLAEGQAGAFYPFNLLCLGLLPFPSGVNLSILLTFIIAATGAYLLARTLDASVSAALTTGVAYALSGFFVAHVKHMSMVNAACWIPILLWLVEQGVRGNNHALLGSGLVLAMQWLAGAPQITYYTAGVAILYFLGRSWQHHPVPRTFGRRALFFGIAITLSVGLAALQLLPTYELINFSERAGGVSYEFAARFPYALQNLKTFIYPLANGSPGTGDYDISGIFWEDYAYFGIVPLLLGLVGGVALARRSHLARLLLGLASITFLVALGDNTPLFRLAHRLVPGMSFFRFPQRLLAFSVLFYILLAALALTHLQKWVAHHCPPFGCLSQTASARWHRFCPHLVGGIALCLVIADLYFYHVPWNAIIDADVWLAPPQTAQAIKARGGSTLYRVLSYDVYDTFRAAYRQAQGWRGDLGPYVAQREFLQPSLNLIYDVPAAKGYVNLVPDCLVALWGNEKQKGLLDAALIQTKEALVFRPEFAKLLSAYNVRFLITSQPVKDCTLELVGVYGPDAYLYENRQALSRAFLVPQHTIVSDVPAALALMRSPDFDPHTTVILFESPPTSFPRDTELEGTVDVVTYAAQTVVLETETNAPGWLVLSDTHYPGWEATIDGQPTPIYQANGCVRAIAVPAGRHRVIFGFRPHTFYTGVLVSAMSGVLFLVLWAVLKKQDGRRAPKSGPAIPGV